MHTLEVVDEWRGDLTQCVVVTPCAEALALAQAAGAQAWREPAGGDLNAALRYAAAGVAARGGVKLMVAACDLPQLSAAALREFAAQADGTACAAIAPDRAGSGSNALALEVDARELFHFGAGSCARHHDALAHAGYRVVRHVSDALAFDLDTPQDHAQWLAQCDARMPRGMAPPVQQPMEEAGK
jgi:2-phospho-L-lactate guanylyltransferase